MTSNGAVQVAVLHMVALTHGIWIDGYSLFLDDGRFRDVDIRDAYRAIEVISARAPGVSTTTRKVKVDDFARAVQEGLNRALWMQEAWTACGCKLENLDKAVVQDAVDKALSDLPRRASPDDRKRAVQVATLRRAIYEQFLLPEDRRKLPLEVFVNERDGIEDVLNSLNSHDDPLKAVSIGEAYAGLDSLMRRNVKVNRESFTQAQQENRWISANYEKLAEDMHAQCTIPGSLNREAAEEAIRDCLLLVDDTRTTEYAARIGLIMSDLRGRYADKKFTEATQVVESLVQLGTTHYHTDPRVVHAAMEAALKKGRLTVASFATERTRIENELAHSQSEWMRLHFKETIKKAEEICGATFTPSSDIELIETALARLPVNEINVKNMSRAALGALLTADLQDRLATAMKQTVSKEGLSKKKWIQRTQMNGYQEKDFARVMHALFHPNGKYHDTDVKQAYDVIRGEFHDKGLTMFPGDFDAALKRGDASMLPLAEKAEKIREWIRYAMSEGLSTFIRGDGNKADPKDPSPAARQATHGCRTPILQRLDRAGRGHSEERLPWVRL